MISHVFPVTGGKSVVPNDEFSSHGLRDVGGLSIHLERHPFGRFGGELSGLDCLSTEFYGCIYLTTGLRGPVNYTVGRPHTAIEEPTTRLFTYICIKLMVGRLL